MDVSITRTDKEFRSALQAYVALEGVTYELAAEELGLNKWHIGEFLNNPEYTPSRRVRVKCNIRNRKPDRRVIIYKGSDMVQKNEEIKELTDGKYELRRIDES